MQPAQRTCTCAAHLPDCLTALLPRSVGRLKRPMAEMCVKAVLAVADLDRKDVNLDLIKVRVGGARLQQWRRLPACTSGDGRVLNFVLHQRQAGC